MIQLSNENRCHLMVKSVLNIHQFCICLLTCLLKFTYNPKFNPNPLISLHELLWLFVDMHTHTEQWEIWVVNIAFPAEVHQVNPLSSCFSSHMINVSFSWPIQCHVFSILCFLWWFYCLTWSPNIVLQGRLVILSTKRL